MKFFNQKGFTLTELIISVGISSIVLLFVFSFVADAIEGLAETSQKTKVLNEFYEFVTKMDNYNTTFITGSVLIDTPANVGYDVLMLKNYDSTAGVLLALVDAQSLKIVPNASYSFYGNKILGFKELTATNITDLTSTPNLAYNLIFFKDKVFPHLVAKDLQADYYNTGSILSIDTNIVMKYLASLDGTMWTHLSQDDKTDLYPVNLNF